MSVSSTPYHLENSIIEIFHQKMLENPYLHEISDYFVLRNKNIPNEKPMELNNADIQISEVRISTKVVLCSLGVDINLDTFFKHIEPYTNVEKNYKIISLEYMDNVAKGIPKQKKKKQSQANSSLIKKRQSFYNQVTIIVEHIKSINIKIFRNGSIHITGIVDEDLGKKAIQFLCDEINLIYLKDQSITNNNIIDLGVHNWKVVLINSDFSCNFKIRREKLFEILDTKCGLVVNYESDNYPGVKTSYYWNVGDTQKTGICKCKIGKTCSGKGLGTEEESDSCRKITISIFQSGKIIITGARDNAQIKDAYQFITRILRENYFEVARPID
jgi:TATA-box binding protein (TBP) (component of TFIID and TFIIIB)